MKEPGELYNKTVTKMEVLNAKQDKIKEENFNLRLKETLLLSRRKSWQERNNFSDPTG